MKQFPYKIIAFFLMCFTIQIVQAQVEKYTKKYTKTLTVPKDVVLNLNANYADIEIIEWKKDKVSIEAELQTQNLSENEEIESIDKWNVSMNLDGNEVYIDSDFNKNEFRVFSNSQPPFILDDFYFPEISVESLGVFDTLDIEFPKFDSLLPLIDQDNVMKELKLIDFLADLNFNTESDSLEFQKIKGKLQKWQEDNKDKLVELERKSKEFSKKYSEERSDKIKERSKKLEEIRKKRDKLMKEREVEVESRIKERQKELEKRIKEREKKRERLVGVLGERSEAKKKMLEERKELLEKRKVKRVEMIKRSEESRNKIKEIINKRRSPKLRSKMTIKIPKGTVINMNVNYSKVTTK